MLENDLKDRSLQSRRKFFRRHESGIDEHYGDLTAQNLKMKRSLLARLVDDGLAENSFDIGAPGLQRLDTIPLHGHRRLERNE